MSVSTEQVSLHHDSLNAPVWKTTEQKPLTLTIAFAAAVVSTNALSSSLSALQIKSSASLQTSYSPPRTAFIEVPSA
jgi:hypothetical protein